MTCHSLPQRPAEPPTKLTDRGQMQNQPITGIDSAQPTSCTQITIKGTQEKKKNWRAYDKWLVSTRRVNTFHQWRNSSVGRAVDQNAGRSKDRGSVPCSGKGFFFGVNFQCRLSYGVCTALECVQSHASRNACAHLKNPKHWQSCRCLDTRKRCTR